MYIRSPSSKSPGPKNAHPQSDQPMRPKNRKIRKIREKNGPWHFWLHLTYLRWNEFDFQKSNKEMVIKKSFSGTNVSIECSMYLNEKTYLVFYFLVPGISNQVRSN